MSIRRSLALLAVPAAALALAPTSNGGAAAVGNGNGIKAFGGTFSLVLNP